MIFLYEEGDKLKSINGTGDDDAVGEDGDFFFLNSLICTVDFFFGEDIGDDTVVFTDTTSEFVVSASPSTEGGESFLGLLPFIYPFCSCCLFSLKLMVGRLDLDLLLPSSSVGVGAELILLWSLFSTPVVSVTTLKSVIALSSKERLPRLLD